MYQEKKEPWQVREMFPDVALHLETAALVMEVRDALCLEMTSYHSSKHARIRIPLEEDYFLQIEPVDRGYLGCAEWFTYTSEPDENGKPIITTSMRTCVSLLKGDRRPEQENLVTFTTHCGDIEETIRTSLQIVFNHTGLRLNPQVRNQGKNWKKSA